MRRTIVLVALSVCAILALPGLASAATFNVPADFAAIQAAIDGATAGDTVQVAAGTATLAPTQIITIPNDKLGLRLVGAGSGQTILQKSSGTTSQPIIFIGPGTPSFPAPASTVVEGFTLKNSGATSGARSSATSAYTGIAIRASGASAADPAVIRNCEFLEFSDTGIVMAEVTVRYWEFAGNTFDGSRLAVWVNSNDFVTVRDNVFRDYSVAIGTDAGDAVTDLIIAGNDLLGGTFDPAPTFYRGLYLSSAATAEDETKNWNISNNLITGATNGILIQAPTSGAQSLTGVVVENNYIAFNNVTGTVAQTPTFADAKNSAAKQLIATNNWWGQATGPAAAQISGSVITDPYLTTDYQDPSLSAGAGFWPATEAPPVVSTPASSSWSLMLTALSAVMVGGRFAARRRKDLAA
jgi:hypothetical protein